MIENDYSLVQCIMAIPYYTADHAIANGRDGEPEKRKNMVKMRTYIDFI